MEQFYQGTPESLKRIGLMDAAEIDLQLYGQLCSQRPEPDGLRRIPAEILPSESQTLYYLLSEEWSGSGSVLEIGTLFGASTEAIGLGMVANPIRGSSKYFAADSFDKYYELPEFRSRLEPLLADHPEWEEMLAEYVARGFERAYRALHADRPYSPFLEIRRVAIPEGPEDSEEGLRRLMEECSPCGLVFIDSAKYWHPVRTLASILIDHVSPGSLMVWQDARWFNSFAIPVFNTFFSEQFTLVAIVGNTQIYQYHGGLSELAVRTAMPETAEEFGIESLEQMLFSKAGEAYVRNDAYGVISSALQLAFAAASCGHVERAQQLLSWFRVMPGFSTHEELFDLAEGNLPDVVPGDHGP